MAPTNFTVVVSTHKRPELCRRACDSICRSASNYTGDIDIILVNSSPEPMHISDPSFEEIHVPDATTVVEKRNIGIEQATTDWIVFVDDDCEVTPKTFNTLHESITTKATPQSAAFYPITEFAGPMKYPLRCCHETHFTNHFSACKHSSTRKWAACTLAVFDRHVLEEVGGFDGSFAGRAGGEDVDIGLKLNEHNYVQHCIPETLVYHDTTTWNSLSGNLKRFFHYGLGETVLQKKYPDRTHFKLNNIGTEGVVASTAALVLAFIDRNPVWILVAPLFLILNLLTYAIYNHTKYEKSILCGVILRVYDYAFEAGNLFNAVRTCSPTAPFYRHKSESGKGSQFLFGREQLIYGDELPTLLAFLLTALMTSFMRSSKTDAE